ncbi:MAG: chalcone isomerase family protein [Desulfobacteria bacterium]
MRKLALALSFLLLSSQAFALEIAGVNVPPTVSVHQKTLTLNGAGIRKAYVFVKVYVGSLYTERKVTTTAQLLADPGDKLIRMTFVMKKVEKEKIVDAFSEGLSKNSPAVAGTADAKAFLSWFTSDFMAGDTVDVSLAADGTVSATHDGKALGTVRNPALARAVLLIWFGEKPADAGLKKGMLGNG